MTSIKEIYKMIQITIAVRVTHHKTLMPTSQFSATVFDRLALGSID
jgi:hypothetical protein